MDDQDSEPEKNTHDMQISSSSNVESESGQPASRRVSVITANTVDEPGVWSLESGFDFNKQIMEFEPDNVKQEGHDNFSTTFLTGSSDSPRPSTSQPNMYNCPLCGFVFDPCDQSQSQEDEIECPQCEWRGEHHRSQ